MLLLKSKSSLRNYVTGKKIGFVPTMGGLHEGHISLIRKSQRENPVTLVSIFVNPKQFGPHEDFSRYPRNLARDQEILNRLRVDAVFLPSIETIYGVDPEGFKTYVGYRELENLYCGKYRPGFFNGVLLVVLKLFHLVAPTQAYFGKKDYQQYFLVKKMVADLDMNIKVHGLPTVRDSGGLALSSRNQYLTAEEMDTSRGIYRTLRKMKAWVGEKPGLGSKQVVAEMKRLLHFEKGVRLQYVEIVDRISLLPTATLKKSVILMAAYVNKVRLIDNIEIN